MKRGLPVRVALTAFITVPLMLGISCFSRVNATDYFLTIGGGYSRTGNQASLEANVLFFKRLLKDEHRGEREHTIFFADGDNPEADLQILAPLKGKSETPASDLLAMLHRRGRGAPMRVAYRNHRVEELAGSLDPDLIHKELETFTEKASASDRLIIFVTAHGSGGKKDDPYNTSLDCWGNRKVSAREFTGWLDALPTELPVVMVMAQCYCGGFGHTIFTDLDEAKGLSPHLRAGFFAQQHDLPAAGCRPDIEHDEEFSSYFWGAIAGKTRNGVPIADCDANQDGVISFAEAYAHAVIAGETIDVPLRTSEVLLRKYSRLRAEAGDAKSDDDSDNKKEEGDTNADVVKVVDAPSTDSEPPQAVESTAAPELTTLSGPLESLVRDARPVTRRIITELAKKLDVSLQDDAVDVLKRYEELRKTRRGPGFGPGMGPGRGQPRPSSGRRELLKEVADKWPELGDAEKWRESALLKKENQALLFQEMQSLPSWKLYSERREQLAEADEVADERELQTVKFRRFVHELETRVLEINLPKVADPEIVERYRQMIELEESSLKKAR
ncbi:MAG: hypothetical protein U0892_08360 [Pirellulales bacterium]